VATGSQKANAKASLPGEFDDGSKPLSGNYERLARLIALDHRKIWNVAEISAHFGWTENSARKRLYLPRVQNRAFFLSRHRLKMLAYRAIDELENLLNSADSDAVKLNAAKTILDRAGFDQPPPVQSAPAFSMTMYFGSQQPKEVNGDIIDGQRSSGLARLGEAGSGRPESVEGRGQEGLEETGLPSEPDNGS